MWCAVFFLASAGTSAAYLTVSEIFPMETRAMSIALFYAVGTGLGGIIGPLLFGKLVATNELHNVALGYYLGAVLMIAGGLVEAFIGVEAAQRSLEDVATPLSASRDSYARAMSLADEAKTLKALHDASELLVLVNVWDVTSARTIAGLPGTRAIATASHSIAEAHGYEDGENIPLDLMLAAVERIAAAVDLPVTADLEAGYGDVGTTIRRAIGVGAVGANLEDEMRPLAESVAAVRDAISAGEAEGVPFVLNARTDAYLLAGDRDPAEVLADAIERGQAFLDEGAACVFVPGA